ncbi:MAG: peptidylprolyl isomerase [Patescibacteria group bacterium]
MPESAPVNSPPIPRYAVFFFGIVLVCLAGVAGIYAYATYQIRGLSLEPFVVKTATVFRMPAARINGMPILYSDYVKNFRTLREFYDKEGRGVVPIADEEIANQVMSRLFIQRLVEKYAKEYGVTVTEEDVEKARENLVKPFGSEEAARKDLLEQYGWTLERYMDEIVRPLLLEQKVQEAFAGSSDEENKSYEGEEFRARHILFRADDDAKKASVRKQAEAVLKRLQKGEDFAVLAKEFGSDATKDAGGDLGWFGAGVMVPEFEQAVKSLDAGELSGELVETQYGYHIVKLEEKRMRRNFVAFMNDQIDAAEIEMIIPVKNPFEKSAATGAAPAVDIQTEVVE